MPDCDICGQEEEGPTCEMCSKDSSQDHEFTQLGTPITWPEVEPGPILDEGDVCRCSHGVWVHVCTPDNPCKAIQDGGW